MATQPRTLFESATQRGRIIRQGNITTIIMDGNGAVIVDIQDFQQARKWAQSKMPTANLLTDRARFLDQFPALVSRPGSVQATRGSQKPLEKLVKEMLASGMDLNEWTLPMELKAIGRPPAPKPSLKTAEDELGGADSDPQKSGE